MTGLPRHDRTSDGPRVRTPRSWPAGRRVSRSAAVQVAALLTLFAVQGSVLAGVRADRAAELGAGPIVPVAARQYAAAPPVRLGIPALGLQTRLIGLRKAPDGRLQVPEDPQRVGWYSQGVAPGDKGPAVLVGHVDSYRGPGVFAHLGRVKPGEEIRVRRADGSLVVFVVQQVKEYSKRAFPTKAVYVGDRRPTLRLVTCGGEFDRRAKSYRSNVVVFAVLKPPSAPPGRKTAPPGKTPRAPGLPKT